MGTTLRGVLSSIITCSAAILAGCFSVNWAVDHRTIWESPSTAAISSAIAYYQDRAQGVQWLKAVLAGIAAVSIGSASIKLAHGGLSRLLFDGGSLFLLVTAVFIYAQNVLPSLNDIAIMPRLGPNDRLPQSAFGSITQIASAHAVIATALTGVVLLQGAQHYSDRQVERQIKKELKEAGISVSNTGTASSSTSPVKGAKGSPSSQSGQKHNNGGLAAPSDSSAHLRRSPRKKR